MRTTFAASFASLFVLRAFAAPGLTVTMSQPEEDDTRIITTVQNTGTAMLKLLNHPNSVLSTDETEKFALSGVNGAPKFRGIRMKYSPQAAAQDPASITVLAPGQSVQVTHDISRAFDFGNSGKGEYKIEALDTFTYVDSVGQLASLKAVAEPSKFKLTNTVLPERNFRPRGSPIVRQSGPQFDGCSESQQRDITAAIPVAEAYIEDSIASLTSSPEGERYETWFGYPNPGRLHVVKEHFTQIQGKSADTTYDCSTCSKPNVYAYVYPDQPGKIYLCPQFWKANTAGTDSKAGTLVHEQTHFRAYGGTQDYAYGQSYCKQLADERPNDAMMNADNHEYFAENDPAMA